MRCNDSRQSPQHDAAVEVPLTVCTPSWLTDFNRILLGLELEPWLREKSLSNQRNGGLNKGSSKLTKAERVSVRKEIAHAAGVSEGSVTKVDQLEGLHPELVAALQNGEIRIHRAWLWRTFTPETSS